MQEPTWTFNAKLEKLDTKITRIDESLHTDLAKAIDSVNTAVKFIKTDVQNDVKQQTSDLLTMTKNFTSDVQSTLDSCKQVVESHKTFLSTYKEYIDETRSKFEQQLELQDNAQHARETLLKEDVAKLATKIDTLHFDIIDNEDNVAITYVNPDGKLEFGGFRKTLPDGKTLIATPDKKLAWKFKFDIKDFDVQDDVVTVRGMSLTDGSQITADKIHNDLSNATYNISALYTKVNGLLHRLNSYNSYMAANNFKTNNPSQEQLDAFVVKCLSTSDNKITKENIPHLTKIKNTYNNHIWILNRVTKDGLTRTKWEDFGSDTVCIATNDGTTGLVTGSQERYMGFIDLAGRISINGLQEDITNILQSIKNINNDLVVIQRDFSAKLTNIEDRLTKLEK